MPTPEFDEIHACIRKMVDSRGGKLVINRRKLHKAIKTKCPDVSMRKIRHFTLGLSQVNVSAVSSCRCGKSCAILIYDTEKFSFYATIGRVEQISDLSPEAKQARRKHGFLAFRRL